MGEKKSTTMSNSLCQCPHCRYSRKEISKEFYLGYLYGSLEADKSVLKSLEAQGFVPTGLSCKETSVGQLMSVIDCCIDCTEQEIELVKKHQEIDQEKLSEPEVAEAFQKWLKESGLNELSGSIGIDNAMHFIQEAFAAGIRAAEKNITQWHDLTGHPDDLPNTGDQVLVAQRSLSGYVFFDVACYENGCWDKDDDEFITVKWKEIE